MAAALQLFSYAVEHTIYEMYGFRAGEPARNLERFVDDYGSRSIGIAEQLRDRRSKKIAIDGGHALEAPVFGVAFDEAVDLFNAVGGDAE